MSLIKGTRLIVSLSIVASAVFALPAFADTLKNASNCHAIDAASDVRTLYGYAWNRTSTGQYITCPIESAYVATISPVMEVGSVAATTTCYLRTRTRQGGSISYSARSVSGASNQTMYFPTTSVSALSSYSMDCWVPAGAKLWQYRY